MMLKYLKKFFSPKNKITVESLDEKAIRMSNAFAKLIIDKYDFDDVIIGIDDQKNVTSDSMIYQALCTKGELSYLDTESEIKNKFLKYGDKSSSPKRLITFKLLRKYNDLYEHQHMFAMVSDVGDDLFFLTEYNDGIFEHYTVDDHFKDFGNFKTFSFYSYNDMTNKFSHFIDIPLSYEGSKLSLRDYHGSFFTPYRTYIVRVEIDIDNQRFSRNSKITISFGNKILKSVDCEISSHADFEQQVSKILFPFNLSNEQLNDLHIEDLSLEQLGSSFDSQYEVYEMAKI